MFPRRVAASRSGPTALVLLLITSLTGCLPRRDLTERWSGGIGVEHVLLVCRPLVDLPPHRGCPDCGFAFRARTPAPPSTTCLEDENSGAFGGTGQVSARLEPPASRE